MKNCNIAILGATGAVGREMLNVLEEYDIPVSRLKLLSSARSAGSKIPFRGEDLTVEEATDASFEGMDFVLGAVKSGMSRAFAPAIVKSGAVYIDNSSAFRMDPAIPLVVPEINGEDAKSNSGIIANPNCSTIITAMAVGALNCLSPIESMVACTYQAVSGAGQGGLEELERQMDALARGEKCEAKVFPTQIALNVIPFIGSIHYAITDAGGVSPNVVQANASVLYMVRANKVADSVKLQKRVDAIAEGAALMTGTSYERVFIDGTAETLPNFTLEALLHASFAETGVPQYTAEELAFASSLCRTFPPQTRAPGIGAKFDGEIAKESRALSENMTKPMNDFLLPLYSGEGFLPGSTDVGDVSWQTPTAQALIAAWPAGVPGHSWQVVACGKTSLAHKAILYAGKTLATAAIALIDDPALLQKAREEYAGRAGSGYVCPIEPDAVPIAI